jgi:hypothetical protein
MGDVRNRRRADRIRAAICIVLADARGAPMRISEIVDAVKRLGIDLGPGANKTISDALRWEVGRGHARVVRRGVYARDHLPRSTEYHMRERVAAYVRDPTKPCVRPDYHLILPGPDPVDVRFAAVVANSGWRVVALTTE